MRAALLSLACVAGIVAACSSGDPGLPHPGAATTSSPVAAHPARATVPLAQASRAAGDDDEEPMDVSALRRPQPDDTEPEPVK